MMFYDYVLSTFVLICKYVYNFIVRIERSNNIIIRNIVSYDTLFTSNV